MPVTAAVADPGVGQEQFVRVLRSANSACGHRRIPPAASYVAVDRRRKTEMALIGRVELERAGV